MARKQPSRPARELFELNPGYDERGNSPWHWLEPPVPQELYFALFSNRRLAPHWQPWLVRMVTERKQGDFFFLGGLYVATEPAVEVVRDLVANKFEALPIRPRAKKSKLPPLFLLHPLESADLSTRAKVTRFDDGRIMYVAKFAFSRDKINGMHFFTARGNHGTYIVSPEFRAAIEGSGLKGLGFSPLRGYSG